MEEVKGVEPKQWQGLAKSIYDKYLVKLCSPKTETRVAQLLSSLTQPASWESMGLYLNFFLVAREILALNQLLRNSGTAGPASAAAAELEGDAGANTKRQLAALAEDEHKLLSRYDSQLKPAVERLTQALHKYFAKRNVDALSELKVDTKKDIAIAVEVCREIKAYLNPFMGANKFYNRTLESLETFLQVLNRQPVNESTVMHHKVKNAAMWRYIPFIGTHLLLQDYAQAIEKETKKEGSVGPADPLASVRLVLFEPAEIVLAFAQIRKQAEEVYAADLLQSSISVDITDLAKLETICAMRLEDISISPLFS